MPRPSYLLEICVERVEEPENGSAPLRVRLSARLPVEPDGEFPREEVDRLLREIRSGLDRAVPPRGHGPAGPDRPLPELLEAYRPRQPELIDLLRDEGELREGEYLLLKSHLAGPGRTAPPGTAPTARAAEAAVPASLAAAPAGAEPVGPTRPVAELLERYQIVSIRQAGAVRARRQISFDEYMALKRHFGTPPSESSVR